MRLTKERKDIEVIKLVNDNKLENLEDYILNCAENDFEIRDVTVVTNIYFDENTEYQNFADNLSMYRDCLVELGHRNKAAAVYLNNKLKFIVLPEGYNYAKYIAIM